MADSLSRFIYCPFVNTATILVWGKSVCTFSKTGGQGPILEHLTPVIADHGITDVLIPDTSQFNATIVAATPAYNWHKARQIGKVTIWRGPTASGLEVPKGTAAVFFTRDCATVILRANQQIIAAHAGRDELIDWARIMPQSNIAPRTHESVIDAMINQLPADPKILKQAKTFVAARIEPENFSHPPDSPTHGVRNRAMINYLQQIWPNKWSYPGKETQGQIWLFGLIRTQLLQHGLLMENIEGDCSKTFSDVKMGTREHRYWSHRRGDRSGYNVVTVIHHP